MSEEEGMCLSCLFVGRFVSTAECEEHAPKKNKKKRK